MTKIPTLGEIWRILCSFKKKVDDDRVLAIAAGVTFYTILAIVPAITALISIFGLVSTPQNVPGQLSSLTRLMPQEAAVLLTDQATRIASKANASLSLTALTSVLIALWSANGGTKALIEALGIAYGVTESRRFVRLNMLSLGFTLGGLVFVLVLGGLVAALPLLLGWIWPGGVAETVVIVGRWPVMFAMLLAVLAILYRLAPDRPDARWAWITPGAILAALGLILTSYGLGWYISNFGNYDETYGSLAAVVLLMLWIWLSTAIVLIGAEVNAKLERGRGVLPAGPVALAT